MYRENLVLVDCEPRFLHTDEEGMFIPNDAKDVEDFTREASMLGYLGSFLGLDQTETKINQLTSRITALTQKACTDPDVQVISFQNPNLKQAATRDRIINPIFRLLDSCERAHSFNKYGLGGIKDIEEIDEVTDLLKAAPQTRVIGVNRYLCVAATAIEIKKALSSQEVLIDRSATLDLVAGQDLDRKVVAVSKDQPNNEASLSLKYGVLMTGKDLTESYLP